MKKGTVKIEFNTPKSQTILNFKNIFDAVEYLLEEFTPDERIDLFSDYCKYCGKDKSLCNCKPEEPEESDEHDK
jgi:hypothetical protein